MAPVEDPKGVLVCLFVILNQLKTLLIVVNNQRDKLYMCMFNYTFWRFLFYARKLIVHPLATSFITHS